MRTNYVLVDFENVQPKNLSALRGLPFKIKVFVGASQTRFPRDMVLALQAFGPDAEYIEIEGSGINALDFHIAFYIGRLSAQHPDSTFHVVSKDRGFDPLLRHLNGLNINCKRYPAVTDIQLLALSGGVAESAIPKDCAPLPRIADGGGANKPTRAAARAPATSALRGKPATAVPAAAKISAARPATAPPADKLAAVIAHLARVKAARPRTLKTLESSIRNLLDKTMPADEMNRLVAQLVKRGTLAITQGRVGYTGAAPATPARNHPAGLRPVVATSVAPTRSSRRSP